MKTLDDYEPIVDFTKKLKSLGRRGHGLCGKDADLDYGGQIKVNSAILMLDNDPPIATLKLNIYANICSPNNDDKAEIAQELILDENRYYGEWTGSDYWCFSLGQTFAQALNHNDNDYYLYIEMPFINLEDEPEDVDKNKCAEFAYKAIFTDPTIKDFQASMADLAKVIDNIE